MLDGIDRDLEMRKHIWFGLKRLGIEQRNRFVTWIARQATLSYRDKITEVRVMNHTDTVHESYMDVMMACAVHQVSLIKVCEKLERILKRM